MANLIKHRHWRLDYRLLWAGVLSGIVAIALPPSLDWATRILCIWDTGMVCFLGLTWIVMLRATPASMKQVARSQDEARPVILSLITTSACASLLAIFFMLRNATALHAHPLSLHLGLSVITIVGGWLLVHTVFTLHYAHTYYQVTDRANDSTHSARGGLDFPNDWEPDYWDFLYYSFVVGMTSQVSDVETTSQDMRRLTLLHGVLSFFFNTFILAMSINIIAGLI